MLKKLWRENKLLFLILGIGLFLRLLGIAHGFPYIFHPDEPTIVRSALGVRFFPNPKHFDWPHLYIYLNFFVYMAFAAARKFLEFISLKGPISAFVPIIWNEPLVFYLITRVFTAVLGGLTPFPVYLAGKKLFNKYLGLLAALVMAVLPFHVQHSHYSLADVPMVFLVAWVVYFSISLFKEPKMKNFLWAGLFVGLAASTKYNGGLSALIVAIAFFVRYLFGEDPIKSIIKNIYKPLLSGVMAIIGFLVGTPYALLDYKTFSRTDGPKGAFWQFTNVGNVSLNEQISKFFLSFASKFLSDWSLPFVLLFIFALFYFICKIAVKKFSREEVQASLILFLPALVCIFYISGFSKNRSHYYMIVYPLVVIIIGWALFELSKLFSSKSNILLLLITFIIPFSLALSMSLTFARRDTRLLAADWYSLNSGHNIDQTYTLYYDGSGLDQTLPSFAEKIPTRKKYFKYPYILISLCEKAGLSQAPEYTIGNFLRIGESVCIYKVESDSK